MLQTLAYYGEEKSPLMPYVTRATDNPSACCEDEGEWEKIRKSGVFVVLHLCFPQAVCYVVLLEISVQLYFRHIQEEGDSNIY